MHLSQQLPYNEGKAGAECSINVALSFQKAQLSAEGPTKAPIDFFLVNTTFLL